MRPLPCQIDEIAFIDSNNSSCLGSPMGRKVSKQISEDFVDDE